MKELKSGTDIRGTALGPGCNLTPDRAELLGRAFVSFLKKKTASRPVKIAVGRDPRLSGEALKEGLVQGLCAMGADVIDCGLATTPSMFFSTYYEGSRCDGAVEITASHLPYDKNGLKFFTKDGGIDGDDVSELIRLAEENAFSVRNSGCMRQFDLMGPYSESLVRLVREKTGEQQPLTRKIPQAESRTLTERILRKNRCMNMIRKSHRSNPAMPSVCPGRKNAPSSSPDRSI